MKMSRKHFITILALLPLAFIQALKPCTNHANGYCVGMFEDTCPNGTYISYSGCGFLEQCCYSPVTPPQAATPTYGAVTHPPGGSSSIQCGIPEYNPNHKIVGGTSTVIEKYPWQVSIRFLGSHRCGGTIISEYWVLTAAHCIEEIPVTFYIDYFTIVAGSSNQKYYNDSTHFYEAAKIISHAEYVKNTRNDIALIKVKKPFDFSAPQKKPICLADYGDDFTGQVCVGTGWGAITGVKEDQVPQLYLREVNLPVVPHNLCTAYMQHLDSNNLCAGQMIGGKDTCQGDSGGPLVCQTPQGSWKQAGIVSYGRGCAQENDFGVYTDVGRFRSWIEYVMQKY